MEHRDGQDLASDWREVKRVLATAWHRRVLFVATVSLVTLVSVLIGVTGVASYTSTATLVLEDESGRNPVQQDLAVPRGAVDVAEALVTLSSNELLERLVREPSDREVAAPGHPEWGRRMGLTTEVSEPDQGTLGEKLDAWLGRRSPSFRLYASLGTERAGQVGAVAVRFLDDYRVEVSLPAGVALETGPSSIVAEYVPGVTIDFGGMRLRLVAHGRPDGRRFLIEKLSPDEAVRRFQERLDVAYHTELERVVVVSVTSTDPVRSRELADALVSTYVEYDRERTLDRARDVVDDVAVDLERHERELDRLDGRIQELLVESPDALDVTRAYGNLSERRGAVAARLEELRTLRGALEDVHASLIAGDHSQASRLGKDLDDPLTRRYLDYIAQLEEERLRMGAIDAGEYQRAVKLEVQSAEAALESAKADLVDARTIRDQLENGDTSGLARLALPPVPAGFLPVDPVTLEVALDYMTSQNEIDRLTAEFEEGYPTLVAERALSERLFQRLVEHVRTRVTAAERVVSEEQGFVDAWHALAEEHPRLEKERIEGALEAFWQLVERSIGARIQGLTANEDSYARELDELRLRLAVLPEAERRLTAARTDRESVASIVQKQREKKHEAEFALASAVGTTKVLRPADFPLPTGGYRTVLSAALGLLFGIALAFVLAVVLEASRGKMRSAEQYAELRGIPSPLGALPSEPGEHEQELDGFRSLRARLRALGGGDELRTIAVTSCFEDEGKTYSSVGLSLAWALEGKVVLLVDANLRTPEVHASFELPRRPGLAEVLEGAEDWRDHVRDSGVDRLDVLSAGVSDTDAADLLPGVQMEAFLLDAVEEYDLVVLDLPALDGAPDVETVAPLVDGVVVVCCEQNGPTPRELARGLELVHEAGGHVLGCVRRPRRAPGMAA